MASCGLRSRVPRGRVAETCVSDLIHPFELVEADGIPVWHDEPVKRDSKLRLTERVHPLCFSENLRAGRNQEVLAVVRVDVVGDEAFDGAGKLAIESIQEHGFKDPTLKYDVGLSICGVERRGTG